MLKNKKIYSFILAMAMVLGMFVFPGQVKADTEAVKTISVVSFNDFHGNVADSGKNVGMAKMISYSKSLLKENPNTIFVSGGDSYQGSAISNLNFGSPVSAMMKEIGVVASAVGNHEFDWGAEYIPGWARDGGFDFLATNIIDKKTGKQVEWVKPYKIVEKDEVKVAFIGLAHQDTTTLTKAEFVKGFEFTDPVEAAKTWVKYLEDGKASEGKPDVIIALTHIDCIQDSETKVITGPAVSLTKVEGLDAVISAHSHKPVFGKVNEVPIIQASHSGRMMAELEIKLNKDNKVVGIEPKLHDLTAKSSEIVPDPQGVKLFEVYEVEAKPVLNQVLGEAAGTFDHNSKETNVTILGRWSSQVMKDATGVQIAIQNGGGLRRPLEKGTITMGDFYEIMPFDNTLVTMELKGADVKKAIDHGINNPEVGNGQFVGLKVEFDPSKEFENRITKITLEDGTPLNMEAYYTVVTNDFLLTGGDKYDFSNAKNVVDTYVPIRDVLVAAVKEMKIIKPEPIDYLIEAKAIKLEIKPETKPEAKPEVKLEIKPETKIEVKPEDKPVVKKYTVKSGDVLWKIADMFNTTWRKLADFNNLKNPNLIYPNQELMIP